MKKRSKRGRGEEEGQEERLNKKEKEKQKKRKEKLMKRSRKGRIKKHLKGEKSLQPLRLVLSSSPGKENQEFTQWCADTLV